jgi:hypothetical protein
MYLVANTRLGVVGGFSDLVERASKLKRKLFITRIRNGSTVSFRR